MCIGIQRARGLNHGLSILCKVVNLWDRWLHEEMELDLDKSIKKVLGQFHDYFIECSTKLYYII
ncbi:hypothetical protein HanXRQr2_Chr10g0462591 [Helianthus annuus]|uniref:Uncharacterized protein n=1 Tax=Helianthus annuus TaxID=4232 RepID=A0A9K3I1K4_HELAN|nr:hypothetical protein HanXRQr2_Chr10g0462591 [Helianthus annuus]